MFTTVSKNDKQKLLNEKDVGNTKNAAKLALNTFTTYMKETSLNKSSEKKISEGLKNVLYRYVLITLQ